MNISPPSLSPLSTTPQATFSVSEPTHNHPTRTTDSPPNVHTLTPGAVKGSGAKKTDHGQESIHSSAPDHEFDVAKAVIYGSVDVTPPTASYTIQERVQRIDAYAGRVTTQLENIESGEEGESNIRFQKNRQFLEPAGYFSGGLLAAGYDPHEKITVTFTSYVGKGKPEVLTDTDKRTYFAWEIAAGALAHDKVQRGGPLNFQFMEVERNDRSKVNVLESLGKHLQNHWEQDIAKSMRDTSGALEKRSGNADAYVVRGTLQSLLNNPDSFEKLSSDAQEAVKRTLEKNGQVIIPNIYGYPLAGYAFIPNTPFDGNYDHRPNEGLMIDLKNGTVREIKGDADFADWAKNNRSALLRSFNASDRQGGKDAHWPKAGDVLDELISGNSAHYPGYSSLLKDKGVPVRETFNYTESRGSNYRLKYDNLNDGIAAKYQEVNSNNAVWSDQTEVFGSSQQNWKAAKEFWGNTFGYVPIVGNAGNIVFGVHDGIYGKTAGDRVGGNSAAVISGLQLVHELLPAAAESGLGDAPINAGHYKWVYRSETREFELARAPKVPEDADEVMVPKEEGAEVNRLRPSEAGNISAYAVADGEQLIEGATRNGKGIYQVKDATTGQDRWFIRYSDDSGTRKVYEIKSNFKLSDDYVQIIDPESRKPVLSVHTDGDGGWVRGEGKGGRWPWNSPSPTPSENLIPKFTDLFDDIDADAANGAKVFDEYLNVDEATPYKISATGYEENGVLRRKLNVTWDATEHTFNIWPSERAAPTPYSTSTYSPNFINDVNRSTYTIIQPSKAGDVISELNAGGNSAEEIRQNRVTQFEQAIPDEDLRARISEVAHQGAAQPVHAEIVKALKEGYNAKANDITYTINYDPLKNETQVTLFTQWYINDLTGDEPRSIPDINVTATRTFTIRESNEISGDRFTIDEFAPINLEVSVPADFPAN